MRRLLAPLAAIVASIPATAQVRHDEQVWVNLTATGSVKDRLIYFAEVQPRIGEDASRLTQLLLRPAIGWKISDKVSVYQGYAHVIEPVAGGRDRHEDRSFQQVTWNVAKGQLGELQSRTRFEQRWFNTGSDTGFRLRQMGRWELPLQRKAHPLSALTYAEGFIALNSTDWGQSGGLDQVRVFVGAEIPIGGASTIEAGYLAQVLNRDVDRWNHVASISLFLRH